MTKDGHVIYFQESKTTCAADCDRCFNKPLNNLLSFTLRPD